jgi:hypothetical protein
MTWLWRALARNLLLALTSLVCAGVLWVYADGATTGRRTVLVPVRIQRTSSGGTGSAQVDRGRWRLLREDGTPFSDSPPAVRVRLRGSKGEVQDLGPEDVAAFLSLPETLKLGMNLVSVEEHVRVSAGKGLRVVGVTPDEVAVFVQAVAAEDAVRKTPLSP